MKPIVAATCLSLTLLGSSYAAEPVHPQVTAAIKDLQVQQALIAENHARIEAKLVTVAEAMRVARIYSSRSGR